MILTPEDLVALEPKTRLQRSRNPWKFPADIREVILTPVRDAHIDPPLVCSLPLIDAVPLHAAQGVVIPLSNYTVEAVERVDFTLKIDRPVERIETVYQGALEFQQTATRVSFSMPLDCTDYVKIYWK